MDHASVDAVLATAVLADPIMTGVYFLIRDGRITYVGRGVHIALRIAIHAKTKRFDSWSWIPCGIDKLTETERRYIDLMLPEDNRDGTTRRLRGDRRERKMGAGIPKPRPEPRINWPIPHPVTEALTDKQIADRARMSSLRDLKASYATLLRPHASGLITG